MDNSNTGQSVDPSTSSGRTGTSNLTKLLFQNKPKKKHSLSYSIAQPRREPYRRGHLYKHRRACLNPQYQALVKQIKTSKNKYSLDYYLSKRLAAEQNINDISTGNVSQTSFIDRESVSTSKDIAAEINTSNLNTNNKYEDLSTWPLYDKIDIYQNHSKEQSLTCSDTEKVKTRASQNHNPSLSHCKQNITSTRQGNIGAIVTTSTTIVENVKSAIEVNSKTKIRFNDRVDVIDSFGKRTTEKIKDIPGIQHWKKPNRKHKVSEQNLNYFPIMAQLPVISKKDKITTDQKSDESKSGTKLNKSKVLSGEDKVQKYSKPGNAHYIDLKINRYSKQVTIDTIQDNSVIVSKEEDGALHNPRNCSLEKAADTRFLKSTNNVKDDLKLANDRSHQGNVFSYLTQEKNSEVSLHQSLQSDKNDVLDKVQNPVKKTLREMILDDALKKRPVSGENIVFSRLKETANQKNVGNHFESSSEKKKINSERTVTLKDHNLLPQKKQAITDYPDMLLTDHTLINKSEKTKINKSNENLKKTFSDRFSLVSDKLFESSINGGDDIQKVVGKNYSKGADLCRIKEETEIDKNDIIYNAIDNSDTFCDKTSLKLEPDLEISDNEIAVDSNDTATAINEYLDMCEEYGFILSPSLPFEKDDVQRVVLLETLLPDKCVDVELLETLFPETGDSSELQSVDVELLETLLPKTSDSSKLQSDYVELLETFLPETSDSSKLQRDDVELFETLLPETSDTGKLANEWSQLLCSVDEDTILESCLDENTNQDESLDKLIGEILAKHTECDFLELEAFLFSESQTDMTCNNYQPQKDFNQTLFECDDSPPILMPFDEYMPPKGIGQLTSEMRMFGNKKTNTGRIKPYWEMMLGLKQKHAREKELFKSAKAFLGDGVGKKRRTKSAQNKEIKKKKLDCDNIFELIKEIMPSTSKLQESESVTHSMLSVNMVENSCRSDEVDECEYSDSQQNTQFYIKNGLDDEYNNNKSSNYCSEIENASIKPSKQLCESKFPLNTEVKNTYTLNMGDGMIKSSKPKDNETFMYEDKIEHTKHPNKCKTAGKTKEDELKGSNIENILKTYKRDTYRKKLRERKDIVKENAYIARNVFQKEKGKSNCKKSKDPKYGNTIERKGKIGNTRKALTESMEDQRKKLKISKRQANHTVNKLKKKTPKKPVDWNRKEAKLELIDIVKATLIKKNQISNDRQMQIKSEVTPKKVKASLIGPKTWKSLKNLDILTCKVKPPLRTTLKKLNKDPSGTDTTRTSEYFVKDYKQISSAYKSCLDQPVVHSKKSKRYICRYCGRKETSSQNLLIHREEDHPHRCHNCCLVFPDKQTSKDHYWTHFKNVYECKICDLRLQSLYIYNQHLLKKSHIRKAKEHQQKETSDAVDSISEIGTKDSSEIQHKPVPEAKDDSAVLSLCKLLMNDTDENPNPMEESQFIIEISNAESAACRPFTQNDYEAMSFHETGYVDSNQVQEVENNNVLTAYENPGHLQPPHPQSISCSSDMEYSEMDPYSTWYTQQNLGNDLGTYQNNDASNTDGYTEIDPESSSCLYPYLKTMISPGSTDIDSEYTGTCSDLAAVYAGTSSEAAIENAGPISDGSAGYTDVSEDIIGHLGYTDRSFGVENVDNVVDNECTYEKNGNHISCPNDIIIAPLELSGIPVETAEKCASSSNNNKSISTGSMNIETCFKRKVAVLDGDSAVNHSFNKPLDTEQERNEDNINTLYKMANSFPMYSELDFEFGRQM